jgi:hypothetical protein
MVKVAIEVVERSKTEKEKRVQKVRNPQLTIVLI